MNRFVCEKWIALLDVFIKCLDGRTILFMFLDDMFPCSIWGKDNAAVLDWADQDFVGSIYQKPIDAEDRIVGYRVRGMYVWT
jgi:hypothetical protein